MSELTPATPQELSAALLDASASGKAITLNGAGSKHAMGGPKPAGDVQISTRALNRVLKYEPRDLTISVECGMPWAGLSQLLASNKQLLPLDPPCAETATVGGIIATNSCGPRRRLYGAARDLVIGIGYASLEGCLLESGGMVVKNVAGFDVQKILIGSFGTLAAITSINFKLSPLPEATRTYVLAFHTIADAVASRDVILGGVLQPAALDVLNRSAAAQCGLDGDCLVVRAGGSEKILSRYDKELQGADRLDGEREAALWSAIENFAPRQRFVVRAGHPMTALAEVLASAPGACVARAGNGITYLGFEERPQLDSWMRNATWARVVEWAPPDEKPALDQWPEPDESMPLMRRMKKLFDPNSLLNRGRLYGRL